MKNKFTRLITIRMNKKILILGLIILFPFSLMSQYAFVNTQADEIYQNGVEYFEQKQYTAAQNKFEDYQNHKDKERLKAGKMLNIIMPSYPFIYIIRMEKKKVKSFVEAHPTHPKASEAYFELGNFYFREKNYAKSIQYYEKTDGEKLRVEDRTDYQFKIAYAYFSRKAFEEALPYFNRLKRRDNQYQSAAKLLCRLYLLRAKGF